MHFQDFLKMTDMKMEVLQEQYKERLMFRMDDQKNEEFDGAIRRLTSDVKYVLDGFVIVFHVTFQISISDG